MEHACDLANFEVQLLTTRKIWQDTGSYFGPWVKCQVGCMHVVEPMKDKCAFLACSVNCLSLKSKDKSQNKNLETRDNLWY